MRTVEFVVILLLATSSSWAAARRNNEALCVSNPPEVAIKACTALIQALQGQGRPKDLAYYYWVRSFAFERLGQLDRAAEDFGAITALDPTAPGAFFQRGRINLEAGRIDNAFQDFNETIPLVPRGDGGTSWSRVFELRGAIYETKQQYAAAIADYTEAITRHTAHLVIAPRDPDTGHAAYHARARVLHLQGEDAQALPDADKAVSLRPKEPAYLETRAEIHETLGQRDAAIADYRMALTLDPNRREATNGLKRLGVDR